MWQKLRNELHPRGVELVTVGLDVLGADSCAPFIEAARPEHPSLIDEHHRVAELFGIVNIPNSVWIDEQGMIVRPTESAPAPQRSPRPDTPDPASIPGRIGEMMAEAAKIKSDSEPYHAALLDWVEHGADSQFALSPDEVVERSGERSDASARGHAHFELGTHLEQQGHHDSAVEHFREAHRLVPVNFSYRRQAWSLEPGGEGPLERFWQGPADENPEAWPYDGDWVSDMRQFGADTLYPTFQP